MIIALIGRRCVGKSTAADHLVERHGFQKVHAFDGGKVATLAYFEHLTNDAGIAHRMVYGDLKDKPSQHLPGNAHPREFMERFGRFMGVEMGPEWTLEQEIRLARQRDPHANLVAESIVYEGASLRRLGAFFVRLERIGYEGLPVQSDAYQEAIQADLTVRAGSVDDLCSQIDAIVDQIGVAEETFGPLSA